ncbi:uncharacterized protein DDB_G0287625 isoform X2 [Condylostylus longicornis]|nr:uncharacterized protein DDB_G0287625 isoform X2 [Condylostylus longicornis]XP_055386088.1 uncharacterized protein DDB_G0287625 isoform X2 [Condylostylus longicornis]
MSSRLDTLSPTDCSIESPATSIMTQTAHLLYDQHSSEEELEVINGPSSIAAAAAAALTLSSEDVNKILSERGTAESVASETSSIEPEVFETESSPKRASSTTISETRKRSLPHSSDDEVRNLLESVPTPVNFRTSPPLEALKPNRNLNLMFRATTPLILTETSRGIENIKISCDSNSTKDSHNSSTQDFLCDQNFDFGACGGISGTNNSANDNDNILNSHHLHNQHLNNHSNHHQHHHHHHQNLNNSTNLINNSTNNITTTNLSLTTQIETTNPNNTISSIVTSTVNESPTTSSAIGNSLNNLLNSNGKYNIEKPPPFRLLEEKNFNISDRIGGIRHFNHFIPYHHNHHQFYGNNSNTSSSITQLIPSNAVNKTATMVSISASSSDVRSISPPAKLFHCAISPRRRPSRTHHAPQRLQRPHRPCLDFDKMQQLKARSVSSWRQNEHSGELSVFCW